MEYIVPESEWGEPKKVQMNYSKIHILQLIHDKMSIQQRNQFKKTCFGHLINVRVRRTIPQLVQHLLLRSIPCPNSDEAWFKINGLKYVFGLKEYTAIMGLKTKRVIDLKKHNLQGIGSFRKFFSLEKRVKKQDIREKFQSYGRKNDEMMIKLCKLYILSDFLMGDQQELIKTEYVDMVDIDWIWEDYHWGRISFEKTIEYIKSAPSKHRLAQYPLYGCPIALQIWGYEVLSNMGIYVESRGHLYPRITNWDSTK